MVNNYDWPIEHFLNYCGECGHFLEDFGVEAYDKDKVLIFNQ
jgi:hypothetical protein